MNDEELDRLIIENQSEDGSIDISDQEAMADEIMAWHTRKLKEAVREEWKLISEVAHSANITAELFISKAREERLAELEKESR